MNLEETVDYLAEELDLKRSDSVREVGLSVAIVEFESVCTVDRTTAYDRLSDVFQILLYCPRIDLLGRFATHDQTNQFGAAIGSVVSQ